MPTLSTTFPRPQAEAEAGGRDPALLADGRSLGFYRRAGPDMSAAMRVCVLALRRIGSVGLRDPDDLGCQVALAFRE